MGEVICLTDETMAAYVDGNLPGEERVSAEKHLAECFKCRRLVALIIRSQSEVPDAYPKPPRTP